MIYESRERENFWGGNAGTQAVCGGFVHLISYSEIPILISPKTDFYATFKVLQTTSGLQE